jgi:hypothetical protein
MKLKEAFYCPECQEVFNYAEYQTVCPSCANRYAFSLQRTWFSQPKEVQNENIKINRVYVTPARYDVCRAGAAKDDCAGFPSESQSDPDEVTDIGNRLKRNRSIYRLGIGAVRNFAKLLDCIDVYRKHRKPQSSIKSKIQRFDADTLAGILHRR